MRAQALKDDEAAAPKETSPGVPAERELGEPDTGDTVTATSEGADTAGR